MSLEKKSIPILRGFAQHLVQTQHLTSEQCHTIHSQALSHQLSFISELIQSQFLQEDIIAMSIAEFFELKMADLSQFQHSHCSKDWLKLALVQESQGFPFCENEQSITFAVFDPTLPLLNDLRFFTGKNIELVIVEATKLRILIESFSQKDLNQALKKLTLIDVDSHLLNSPMSLTESTLNAPVVRVIDKIIDDAIHQQASDIHFEPSAERYCVRFRRDGILSMISELPIKLSPIITARLKILANLDISERRLPQDGRFHRQFSGQRKIDFRLNTCPTLHGEKIVIRILESKQNYLCIESLGLNESQKSLFLKKLNQPQGMILVTGPTGSGKTTSLYAGLNHLNNQEKNISTVEDPIEIQVSGINQVQINLKTGLTFAMALRAFLRQDPDIMMVGEIRDLETAEIAIKASQTGHLVLSTLHTNNAAETIIRLINMGIAPYNIASSVTLIIAQRLLRQLCPHCKKRDTIPIPALIEAGFDELELQDLHIFSANDKSCRHCENGYRGRIALFEVLPISERMAQLMMGDCNAQALAHQAQREKIPNLRQSGLEKIREGLTSLSELNRICPG